MRITKFIKTIFTISVLIFYLTPSLLAQKVNLKITLEPKSITIGDWIYYRIEATYPKNLKVLWPMVPDSFRNFEVISRSTIDSALANGNITKKQLITLTCFDSGPQSFPSFGIPYRTMNDTTIRYLYTDSFEVNVSNVKVDTSKSLRPIKAPLKVPITFRELFPYILMFFGVLVLAFFIFYIFSRRHVKPVFFMQKPKTAPHMVAKEKLRKLELQKFWQKGEVKRYHIELTDIIREYIELRFEIPALESVTEDIIGDLKSVEKNYDLISGLQWFLELSDQVKFAKYVPLPDENEKCMHLAYEFIDKTVENENAPELKPEI